MRHREVYCGEGGWRLEVYDDERDLVGFWFGTRQECEACPTARVKLYPMGIDNRPDGFDLACERRCD